VCADLDFNWYIDSMASRTGRTRRPKADGLAQDVPQPQTEDQGAQESQKSAKPKVCFGWVVGSQ